MGAATRPPLARVRVRRRETAHPVTTSSWIRAWATMTPSSASPVDCLQATADTSWTATAGCASTATASCVPYAVSLTKARASHDAPPGQVRRPHRGRRTRDAAQAAPEQARPQRAPDRWAACHHRRAGRQVPQVRSVHLWMLPRLRWAGPSRLDHPPVVRAGAVMNPCQTCGATVRSRPAICAKCWRERVMHGKDKAATRWARATRRSQP